MEFGLYLRPGRAATTRGAGLRPASGDLHGMPIHTLRALLVACLLAPAIAAAAPGDAPDPHSDSRPGEVAVTHLDLDLRVDFEAQRLTGEAAYDLLRTDPAAPLRLDTRDLDVLSVRLDDSTEPAPYSLGEARPLLGRALEIPLGADTRRVRIEYRTRPGAAALQWLGPAQTAGGRHPFLFTQSQPILARTWVPCQDSPGVRMTYSATVRVPPALWAVMSAENPRQRSADGIYRFRMEQPIPSYLLALAVGDLEFRELGPRSGVYAEPSVVARAAWELADTEKMIAAAESLYGPYRWGRYDLLVLPPSFPYGGMENPRLTFATPTILAGDRSLVALVAHELAHSWSGNLVTNATWDDYWLNEGFTTYFENRIMEALYGREYSEMLALLSARELEQELERLGRDSPDTRLHLDLAGRDPDDGAGSIAYEKGYFFLRLLEETFGRERWDAFLRSYFDDHAFRSMTTAGFRNELERKLLRSDPEGARRARVDEWLYAPGLPDNVPKPASAGFARVDRQLERWSSGVPAAELDTAGWVTHQWLHFLHGLPDGVTAERLAELDASFGWTGSGNAEIQAAWFERAVNAGIVGVRPALESFLIRVGRRKFLLPLYGALAATPEGREWALGVYARARAGYHSVSRDSLDALLGWPPPGA